MKQQRLPFCAALLLLLLSQPARGASPALYVPPQGAIPRDEPRPAAFGKIPDTEHQGLEPRNELERAIAAR